MKWAAFLAALFLGFAAFRADAQIGSACSTAGWISLGDGTTSHPGYLLACNGSTWGLAGAITSGGLVGIGTASPSQQLQLTGAMQIPATTSSTTGVIYKGTHAFIHDYTASGTSGANTFVGVSAGNFTMAMSSQIYEASFNTGVGNGALTDLTTGYENTAVGLNAGHNMATTTSSVAVGYQALYAMTGGGGDVAVGYQAAFNTTGSSNVAIGLDALVYNTIGAANTIVGQNAGYGLSTLSDVSGNSMLGYQAGYSVLTAANYNTFVGYEAGYDDTTGAENIIIGYYPTTGVGITTGSNNILIGQNLQKLTQTSSNQLNIGNLIFATGLASGSTMSTGNVGIGTATPNALLDVYQGASGVTPQATASGLVVESGGSSGISILTANASNANIYFGSPQGNFDGFIQYVGASRAFRFGTAGADAMRITSAGKVGIGSTTPNTTLDVAGFVETLGQSRVSSTFSKTSDTGLAAITGLSATLAAGKTYAFDIILYTTSGASGGINADLNGGTATATAIIGDAISLDAAAVTTQTRIAALNTGGCGVTAVTAANCHITGTITVNAGGTFIPRFAQNASNATASTVAIGSTMVVQQIN